ncbi:hypothetical protein [Pseudomonas aeruginosa]|uniref:hypothetical protein n=1 Tax=Pseudomonas aeruginosa TaxID=287 RepID=UPI000AB09E82|nr:hypothetical protein [Pseudomonas aeruginosa]
MSVFHRYFRVTSGALVDRLHELKAATEAALEEYTRLRFKEWEFLKEWEELNQK